MPRLLPPPPPWPLQLWLLLAASAPAMLAPPRRHIRICDKSSSLMKWSATSRKGLPCRAVSRFSRVSTGFEGSTRASEASCSVARELSPAETAEAP
eukprot:269712-Pleurochrysis_carterae.AAC.2